MASVPRLRASVRLLPGPATPGGEETWLLHDPLRNRFFRIGWREKELLAHFRPNPGFLPPPTADGVRLEHLTRFLKRGELLEPESWRPFLPQTSPSWTKRLQTSAARLFFHRIPLVAPDRYLEHLLPLARLFRLPGISWLLAALTALALHLISRRLDEFGHTFSYLFSLPGLLLFGASLAAVKTAHELGHALAAKLHGLSVPSMGISLFFFFPVLYTDTSESWRLTDRWARFRIAAAGVTAELLLALLALLVWSFTPDGVLHGTAFLLATTSLVTSLAINLNPLMRLDGYFLLSDALDLPNLMPRAQAVARWRLREFLFGLGLPGPETAEPPGRVRLLAAYGFAVWIYRLFLFLGIALFFYHFLFKAAGILLFLLEVGLFLALPVLAEARLWFSPAIRIRPNGALMRTVLLLLLAASLFFFPWPQRLELPAQLAASSETVVRATLPGRVAALHVTAGDRVQRGNPLVTLESPDLAFAVARAGDEVSSRRIRLQSLNAGVAEEREVAERELARALAELESARAGLLALTVAAPFDGVVSEWNETLRQGEWVARETPLLRLLAPGSPKIVAYAREEELGRIGMGHSGHFLPDAPEGDAFAVTVTRMARANATRLDSPALASPHGGPLPARITSAGLLVPRQALYQIWLHPVNQRPTPLSIVSGRVFLDGTEESVAARMGAWMTAVLIRESGF